MRAKSGRETVSLLVKDGERVLLVRRDKTANLFPFTWTLPSGRLLPGESVGAAAKRVTHELFQARPAEIRTLRKFPQPSPFTDERGPDTVVRVDISVAEASSLSAGRWTYPAELVDIQIFREARVAILELVGRDPVAAR